MNDANSIHRKKEYKAVMHILSDKKNAKRHNYTAFSNVISTVNNAQNI